VRRALPCLTTRRAMVALLAVLGLAGGALLAPLASAVPGPGVGYDVSWPQCTSRSATTSKPLPQGGAFGIVGVNNGAPENYNPCFAEQYAWAVGSTPAAPALYVNAANPVGAGQKWTAYAGPQPCSTAADDVGCAYDYGYTWGTASPAHLDAIGTEVRPLRWWLDVELCSGCNPWRRDSAAGKAANAAVLAGMVAGLRTRPDRVADIGVYTTSYQWGAITAQNNGSPAAPGTDGLPVWYPVGSDGQSVAMGKCGLTATPTGGRVELVQWGDDGSPFDQDAACTPPVIMPSISTVLDGKPAGSGISVVGKATPGSPVTLYVADTFTAEKPVRVAVPDATGAWSATFSLGSNGYVTARDAAGAVTRPLAVSVKLGRTAVRGVGVNRLGACVTRLDGSTYPYKNGQQAILRGRLDRQVAFANVRPRGVNGYWSALVATPCGKPLTVKLTVAGLIRPGYIRFASDAQALVLLKPRR